LFVFALLGVVGCGNSSSDEGSGSWEDAPVVPELTGATKDQFLADVAAADAAGQNPAVFAKVGDSNTELADNLYGFACRPVEWGAQGEFAPVVDKYNTVQYPPTLATEPGCTPTTSFSRFSSATRSGSYSVFPVTRIKDYSLVFGRPDPACSGEEIPVDCEIRLLKPRYTIVMTGTNDLGLDINFTGEVPGTKIAERLALVVTRIRQAGSVPILSNLPPSYVTATPNIDEYGGIKTSNEQIQELADSLKVPMINLWGAMEEDQMIDRGLGPDGVHLSVYGGNTSPEILQNSVNLSDEALRYGANRRNLIWLQTLAALDQVADSP